MILSGDFRADGRIEEIQLSSRLGVSRTPVREALIALEQEGLVASRPNRGFVVLPANEDLVRQTYPVLGALESAAVRLAGDRLKAIVPRLKEINRRLAGEKNKARQHELDYAFHDQLAAACENPRLLTLLRAEWNRARRFDGAHERGMANQAGSCADHDKIIGAIEAGRIEDAARFLDEHWRGGVEVVVKWLKEKP